METPLYRAWKAAGSPEGSFILNDRKYRLVGWWDDRRTGTLYPILDDLETGQEIRLTRPRG